MKKILIYILLASLTACSDFLEEDPKGAIIGTNAISSVEGLEAALTGTYKGLLRTWSRGFLTSSMQGFVMGGDDLTTLVAGNKSDFRQQDQFVVTSGNSHIAMIWNGCYKTIQGANNIINNYQNTTGDKARIDQIVGEAYFLRGLSYYWLVRGFGKVPVILSADFSTDLLTIGKSPETEVYALIEADLQKAEELVANVKRDQGRPNKGSVKALLADVYLTEGGWPIKDPTKYALAAAKAKEVIDNKATYGFELIDDLSKLWSQGGASAIGTSEEVLSFQTSDQYGGSANAFWGDAARPGDEGGWDDYFSEINFFNNFPEGKRKDATFYTVFTKSDGSKVNWQNSLSKHPYYKKFRLTVPNYISSMPVHIIRYAHVLLIYAEAQARSGSTPNTEAYAALNAVRERAGLKALTGLTNEGFTKAVVDERSWEFAGEFTRWFDLVRLELVESANASKNVDDLKPLAAIGKDKYLFPVPLTDANINPNLGQ
ncbi:RagB/SusD family nutrient uptake outer membrane protein [Dyadobacter sp. NIV53]|uniref:RagB/SusD family nutrient uptake outer membrane protein n=1 Tax=Dyadobacter sp. NIV53 TaxID=2861765 RepID=UPI001C867C92|nr:RagB/SusD family nutrient uptake outer membrane protein [Dyadobacter sp. NIV53]